MSDNKNQSSLAPADAVQRRWLYGSNTIILIVAVVLVMGLIDWLTAKYNYAYDCTTGGIFTLSPQTLGLLKQIDQSGQTFYLVNQFAPLGDDQTSSSQAQQVQQLIREYTRVSDHISEFTPANHEDLMVELRKRFGDQYQPYRDALEKFSALSANLKASLNSMAKPLDAFMNDPAAATNDQQAEALNLLDAVITQNIPDDLDQDQKQISDEMKKTLPDWPGLVQSVESSLQNDQQNLQELNKPDILLRFAPEVQKWLKTNNAVFQTQVNELTAYLNLLQGLKPTQSSAVLQEIQESDSDRLLIMGPNDVKVVDQSDMFVPAGSSTDQTAPQYTFKGEQAVNAALLSLIQTQQPKVVFVSLNPQGYTGPGSPFSDTADLLRQSNFDVYEWSPVGGSPDSPQSSGPPPAIGKGVVWIVLDLPAGQMAMMDPSLSQQLVTAIQQHIAAGGNVLFLFGAMPAEMFMYSQGVDPLAGMLASYGIDVKSTYNVVHRQSGSDSEQGGSQDFLVPEIEFSTYPDTPITAPLQSLQTIFFGIPQQDGTFWLGPAVVEPSANLPPGVHPQVIVESPVSSDIWAQPSNNPTPATFNASTDIKSPVPMGVMAQIDSTRIVALGNALFADHDGLGQSVPLQVGDSVMLVNAYPGNAELLLNCMYWLSNQQELIGVSPRATVAMRIGQLSSGAQTVVRLGSFIGPAIVSIAVGLLVFLVRRRI
ncbi:MAG TPA: hypothetical protein VMG59_12380 [Phycisphaerae bacterium]|nr:hypothetical protein [Phycisphaerae bacterium]